MGRWSLRKIANYWLKILILDLTLDKNNDELVWSDALLENGLDGRTGRHL